MAHESFEDEDVAEVVDRGSVAVKVDREERPDVDAVYLAATTAASATPNADAARRRYRLRHSAARRAGPSGLVYRIGR